MAETYASSAGAFLVGLVSEAIETADQRSIQKRTGKIRKDVVVAGNCVLLTHIYRSLIKIGVPEQERDAIFKAEKSDALGMPAASKVLGRSTGLRDRPLENDTEGVLKGYLIIPKMSRLEYELHTSGRSVEGLHAWFESKRIDPGPIFEGHARQKAALEQLTSLLPDARVLHRNLINRDAVKEHEFIVALGGDNHFQHVAHFVEGENILLGVNADPETSVGYLLAFESTKLNAQDFAADRLREAASRISRLQAHTHEQTVEGLCDIYVGERKRTQITRVHIEGAGISADYKCSGVLIAGALGWSGWYSSAMGGPSVTDPETMQAGITEIYSSKPENAPRELKLNRHDKLRLHFLSDDGICAADSLWESHLTRGEVVIVDGNGRSLRAVLPGRIAGLGKV